jgi:hypothetical protein
LLRFKLLKAAVGSAGGGNVGAAVGAGECAGEGDATFRAAPLRGDSAGRAFIIVSYCSSVIAPVSASASSSCILLAGPRSEYPRVFTHILDVSKRAVVADNLVTLLGRHCGRQGFVFVIGVLCMEALDTIFMLFTLPKGGVD